MRGLAQLALLTILALPAAAQAPEELPEIVRARTLLSGAAEALQAAQDGEARLAALGSAVTAHELALGAYREALRRLAGAEAEARATIAGDRARLERLIAALQSIGRAPRSALLAYPTGPTSAARGAALMAETMPLIEQRIAAVREKADRIRQIAARQDAARVEIRGALASLQDLRAKTLEALRRKRSRDLPGRAEMAEQARAAAARAQSLGQLSAALGAAPRDGAAPLVRFSEARGLIPLPLAGTVTAGFGDPDPWGRTGRGITVEARAFAQVTAPWDGTVRYAGPLIDYDQVLVLEPEGGILLVLAGLARIDRSVGETVLAGERLGDLGGPIPATADFLLDGSKDRDEIGTEKLYIEIRRNGAAVDPAPWFDLTRKGNGG